jgi:AcrR family transcriptional regulator
MPSDARRQEILRCALRAFSRANYMRVTIADIAAEAGISEPALYKHFASKKDLFLTLVQQIGERQIENWRALARDAATPADALRTIGAQHFAKALRNKDYTVVMFQAISEVVDEDVRRTLRDVYGRFVAFIEGLILDSQRRGLAPADLDARILAWNMVALGFSLNLVALIDLDVDLIRGRLDRWGGPLFDRITMTAGGERRGGEGPANGGGEGHGKSFDTNTDHDNGDGGETR